MQPNIVQPPEAHRIANWLRVATPYVTVAALALTGCTATTPEHPTDTPFPSTYDPDVEYQKGVKELEEFESLPNGPCAHSYDVDEKQPGLKTPKQCDQAQKHGTAVLVVYDKRDMGMAKNIATRVKKDVPVIFGDDHHLSVTPILASPKAKARFNAINHGTCMDHKETLDYSSVSADTTMDLDAYNFVMGLSHLSACDSDVAGVADGQKSRHLEVMNSTIDPEAVKITRKPAKQLLSEYLAQNVEHEFGHLLGLGHTGELTTYNKNIGANLIQMLKNKNAIDLTSNRLHDATYQEYATYGNVMGIPPLGDTPAPLEDLQRTIIEPRNNARLPILKGTAARSLKMGHVVTTRIGKPVTLIDTSDIMAKVNIEGAGRNTFDRLVFTRRGYNVPGYTPEISVDLMASDNDYAHLGMLGSDAINTHQITKLRTDTKLITVDIKGSKVTVKQKDL
jgi:hypothetical protein